MSAKQKLDDWDRRRTGSPPYASVIAYAHETARRWLQPADADDISGKVSAELWLLERAGRLPEEPLARWVRRRTRSRVIDLWRKPGQDLSGFYDESDEDAENWESSNPAERKIDHREPPPTAPLNDEELKAELEDCKKRLTARQRLCWELWAANENSGRPQSLEELAGEVGVERSVFAEHVEKATQKLDLCMAGKGYRPGAESSPRSGGDRRRTPQ